MPKLITNKKRFIIKIKMRQSYFPDYPIYDEEEPARSVKVVSTHDGVQKEVVYEALDPRGQKEVLTDLLVKSAVHYAMKKQQVFFCYLVYMIFIICAAA